MTVQALMLGAAKDPWSFVAAGAVGTGANAIAVVPSGIVAGDLLVLCGCDDTLGAPVPSGWTALFGAGSGSAKIRAAYKIATSSESSVTTISTTKAVMVMVAYRSISVIDVIGIGSSNGVGTTIATATLTTTVANDLVISLFGQPNNVSAWTAPAGTTVRVNVSATAALSGLLLVDENKTAAGATTVRTATTVVSGDQKSAQAGSFKQNS